MKNICIIGAGYVGLVSGACLAHIGHNVIIVDNDIEKINGLQNGIVPIYEDDLDELLENNCHDKRLSFTTDLDNAVKSSEVIFICVGTPSDEHGDADLSQVYEVSRQIAIAIDANDKIVVVKSTVPVSTNDNVEAIMKYDSKFRVHVVSNPEFLREGNAIFDFMHPDRIVIGAECSYAFDVMDEVYRTFTSVIYCNRRSAELSKYGSNAFLSAKITFINEMANLCEATGADIGDVSNIIGMDHRIGSSFLEPGPGFGGSCFPKDIKALINTGRKYRKPIKLIETVIDVNERRKLQMAWKIEDSISGNIKDKTIAVLGVTFKANTDDIRSSPALTIIPWLVKSGANVKAYDPAGMENAKKLLKLVHFAPDIAGCVDGADVIVILTEWDEFYSWIGKNISTLSDKTIVDLRNMFSPPYMKRNNINYVSIGR